MVCVFSANTQYFWKDKSHSHIKDLEGCGKTTILLKTLGNRVRIFLGILGWYAVSSADRFFGYLCQNRTLSIREAEDEK